MKKASNESPTITIYPVFYEGQLQRYGIKIGTESSGYFLRYNLKNSSLEIDPSLKGAVDVEKFDSGGIIIVPRDPALSELPHIRFPGEELWEVQSSFSVNLEE